MSNIVCDLKSTKHILTDEQQVQEVIRSLPDSWLHMMVNMTHNESIRTFNDIEHHLELEVKRLEATKLFDRVYMVESSSRKALDFKRKRGHKYNQKGRRSDHDKKKLDAKKCLRSKHIEKKNDKTQMKCNNCSNLGVM